MTALDFPDSPYTGQVYDRWMYDGSKWVLGGGADPVTESGSNANGSWTKWADGTMQCWHNWTATGSVNIAYGSLFINSPLVRWTYPVPFVGIPAASVGKALWGTGASWGFATVIASSYADVRIIDNASRASGSIYMSASAIGRWK